MRVAALLCVLLPAGSHAFVSASRTRAPESKCRASALRPRSVSMVRRDEKGYIIPEDLDFDLRAGVSTSLGASALKEIPPPIQELLENARANPKTHKFEDTLAAIELAFEFFGTKFQCGDVMSKDSENQGSSKVLSLSMLLGLSTEDTLLLFGEHYRAVLDDPSGTEHANIRALMKCGVEGVKFPNGPSLTQRKGSWDGEKYSSDSGLKGSSVVSGEAEWDVESDVWIP